MKRKNAWANYELFKTAVGWCGIAWSSRGLRACVLAMETRQAAKENLMLEMKRFALKAKRVRCDDLVQEVRKYFKGEEPDFSDFRLDQTCGTEFQTAVWSAVKKIPYGETRTYRWVAEQIGRPKAVRAVANAIGRNPLPVIIPCHRVIGSDGKLHGFSACGGVRLKKKMLALETRHNTPRIRRL